MKALTYVGMLLFTLSVCYGQSKNIAIVDSYNTESGKVYQVINLLEKDTFIKMGDTLGVKYYLSNDGIILSKNEPDVWLVLLSRPSTITTSGNEEPLTKEDVKWYNKIIAIYQSTLKKKKK